MKKFLTIVIMALAFTASVDCFAGKFSSSSSSYSRPSSSPSRSYSSSPSTYKSTPSAPAAPTSTSKYSSTPSTYKGSGTALSTAPTPRVGGSSWFHHDDDHTVVHEHYYNNGGGFGNSPWFWMWMFDRQQQAQPVVVQGVPVSGSYYPESAAQSQDDTPFWLECLNVLGGLTILVVGGWLVWWILRWCIKTINKNKL